MTRGITLARWMMREELTALWKASFPDQDDAIQYFFNQRFQPENCLVYTINNKVASMLHMLPAKIVAGGCLVPAHYIYAAATLPEYRAKGLMSALLAGADQCGQWRGERYSLLLPSRRELYQYYGKHNYLPYFKTKFVTLSREEMQQLGEAGQTNDTAPTFEQLAGVRNEQLCQQDGAVLWDDQAMAYAAGLYELYGGKLICSEHDGRLAYAIGIVNDEGSAEIVELVATDCSIKHLAAKIVRQLPAESYRLRLPATTSLWGERGEVTYFGMVKPLAGVEIESVLHLANAPYLGLTLD